jgi:hypothetical protein
MQEYDKSSKWLIQHHGDSILRLAGVRDIVAWRPLQAELVQPRRLPDGLIEVRLLGGREAMIESPILKELIADSRRKDIIKFLVARFGTEARALEAELKVVDEDRLDEFVACAATCPDLDSVRERLPR